MQDLPNFTEAVRLSQREYICSEAMYYLSEYGMRLIPEQLLEKMQDDTPPHQPIQGVCWYDILANQ